MVPYEVIDSLHLTKRADTTQLRVRSKERVAEHPKRDSPPRRGKHMAMGGSKYKWVVAGAEGLHLTD